MTKIIYLLIAITTLGVTNTYGQKRFKHKEADKFVWYSVHNGDTVEAWTKKKEVIIPMRLGCKSIEYDYFGSGHFIVETINGFMGVYKTNGKCVIAPTKYDKVKHKSEYSSEMGYLKYYFVTKGNLMGVCDTIGNEIIAPDKYESIQIGTHPYCFEVNCNGKEGIYDLNGKVIFPLSDKYGNVRMGETNGIFYFNVDADDKKNGICDINGNEIIAPGKYDMAYLSYHYDYGFYYNVKKGDNAGVCNMAGVEIIPPMYSDIMYSSTDKCFQYKNAAGSWVGISTDFKLEDAIAEVGDKYRLVDASGKPLNKQLYDFLTYLPEQSMYSAVTAGYTTLIKPDGTEQNPIGKQIFEAAYNLPDSDAQEKYDLYNLLLQTDPGNTYGYNASAYNNLGVIFRNQGDDDTALAYYNKCLEISPNDQTAKSNVKAIKAERRAARINAIGSALSQTLNTVGSIGNYNQQNNAAFNVQSGSSGSTDTRNYQASYNVWAKQAERLYNKLTDKSGYTGSSKTRSVDVDAYHKAQREMRSISIKAANAGNPVQESVYQSKAIN